MNVDEGTSIARRKFLNVSKPLNHWRRLNVTIEEGSFVAYDKRRFLQNLDRFGRRRSKL
jgi:hypothetical protein